jgi:hypothetical protein
LRTLLSLTFGRHHHRLTNLVVVRVQSEEVHIDVVARCVGVTQALNLAIDSGAQLRKHDSALGTIADFNGLCQREEPSNRKNGLVNRRIAFNRRFFFIMGHFGTCRRMGVSRFLSKLTSTYGPEHKTEKLRSNEVIVNIWELVKFGKFVFFDKNSSVCSSGKVVKEIFFDVAHYKKIA